MLQTNISQTSLMSPENFVYWLQGLLELSPDLKTLNEGQVKMIRDHLHYVFNGKQPTLSIPTVVTGPTYSQQGQTGTSVTSITYPPYDVLKGYSQAGNEPLLFTC